MNASVWIDDQKYYHNYNDCMHIVKRYTVVYIQHSNNTLLYYTKKEKKLVSQTRGTQFNAFYFIFGSNVTAVKVSGKTKMKEKRNEDLQVHAFIHSCFFLCECLNQIQNKKIYELALC